MAAVFRRRGKKMNDDKQKNMKILNVKVLKSSVVTVCMALIAVSCIRDEALNAECDILEVTLSGDVLNRAPQIENNKITLIVKKGVSVMALAPEFRLTSGATIEPPSGTVRNFILPQTYTVTSEDGEWTKSYTVTVQRSNTINLEYSFEHVRQVDALGGSCQYDVFYEVGPAGNETLTWASANPAYALTLQGTVPSTFPTYQAEGGVNGKCVALVTRSTGNFGGRVGKPMAAGNLFIGKFETDNALQKPLESTHFGTPFEKIPSMLSGFYKYQPGETYCEPDANGKLVPVEGKTDIFNIYAVMFETGDGVDWLDGTNVLAEDNPNIISTAVIDNRRASDEWVEFSVPFVPRSGKVIDPEKLKNGAYSITVVMSSSEDGDFFRGAIGSTLMVDELQVTCDDND